MTFSLKKFEQATASMLNYLDSNSNFTYFGAGGQVRSIVEAFAMEIEQLYLRTYSALIDAQNDMIYAAFDFARNPAVESSGYVTFYNIAATGLDTIVPQGTQIQTPATANSDSILFETQEDGTILGLTGKTAEEHTYLGEAYSTLDQRFASSISVIQGFKGGTGYTFVLNVDYELDNVYDTTRSYIKWLNTNKPDFNSKFYVTYVPRSTDVLVKCIQKGVMGNVSSGQINTFLVAVPDVEAVSNFSAFTNGLDTETDAERKNRFKDFIESLHKGDITAIYAACKSTPGVYDILIKENYPLAGNISIYVANNNGTADTTLLADVKTSAEGAKAAGITVSTIAATLVTIDVKCKLTLAAGSDKATIVASVQTAVQDYLSKFGFAGNQYLYKLYNTDLVASIKAVDVNVLDADLVFRRGGGTFAKYDLYEDEEQIFNETITVPSGSPYKYVPAYTIKIGSPSSFAMWTGSGQTGYPMEEVDTTPQLGQFRVNYIEAGGDGTIEFNSGQSAVTPTVYAFYNKYNNTNIGEIFRPGSVIITGV